MAEPSAKPEPVDPAWQARVVAHWQHRIEEFDGYLRNVKSDRDAMVKKNLSRNYKPRVMLEREIEDIERNKLRFSQYKEQAVLGFCHPPTSLNLTPDMEQPRQKWTTSKGKKRLMVTNEPGDGERTSKKLRISDNYVSGGGEEQLRALFADTDSDQPPDQGLDALQCTLFPHQLRARQWMINKELTESKKGGILADDMGLGKTLSTIALILSHKPPTSSDIKTTLIVAPLSLLKQWQREIKEKVQPSHLPSIHSQHDKKLPYQKLCQYDIVLATYGLLASEYSRMEKLLQKQLESEKQLDSEKKLQPSTKNSLDESSLNDTMNDKYSLIGRQSKFYRVILDEAHNIKTPWSKTSKGALLLQAEYRWCLTGTPMMNGTHELSPLVRFLRIKPYDDVSLYARTFNCLDPRNKKRYSKVEHDNAEKQLQALLKAIMLRRKKDSIIDGKPIIELKKKTETIHHVVFDEDEQKFYKALEERSQVEISKYLHAGTVGKVYVRILTLLLRMRQACCHPHLHLTDVESDSPQVTDQGMLEVAKSLTPEVVEYVKQRNDPQPFRCSGCEAETQNPTIMSPCGDLFCTACTENFVNLQESNADAIKCPHCQLADVKAVTYDTFKTAHQLEPVANPKGSLSDLSDTDNSDSDYDSDCSSGSEVDDIDQDGNIKGFVVDDDKEDGDLEDNQGTKKVSVRKNRKHKHRETKLPNLADLRKGAAQNKKSRKAYMRYLKAIQLPSAKMTKCCELIANIQETTGEKIIVFSQWTLLLDFLDVAITEKLKIPVCRYDGSMSATARDNAAHKFTTDSSAKVILVSLMAGNAGLNLTAASQVIIMDPFWNPYIENQAIDRTYRIGQTRDVTIHRILTQGTVEDRITAIQQNKQEAVEGALDEKAAKAMSSLSVDDFAFLFGVPK